MNDQDKLKIQAMLVEADYWNTHAKLCIQADKLELAQISLGRTQALMNKVYGELRVPLVDQMGE